MNADRLLIEERIGVYNTARRRAVDYLLSHMNADGSIGPVEQGIYYYRGKGRVGRAPGHRHRVPGGQLGIIDLRRPRAEHTASA